MQGEGETAAERDQREDRRQDHRQLLPRIENRLARESEADRPANHRVADRQKPWRQRDREQMAG
jgi:hypothetical protein